MFSFPLFAILILCAVALLTIFGSERWGVGLLVLLGVAIAAGWTIRRIAGPIHDNSSMAGYGSYLTREFLAGYLVAVAISFGGLLWYRARTRRRE